VTLVESRQILPEVPSLHNWTFFEKANECLGHIVIMNQHMMPFRYVIKPWVKCSYN